MSLAVGDKARIEGDQGVVPSEGRRERCGEQRPAQAVAAAGDVALPSVLSAVIVEGRKTGQRGGLLAADAAEFGHADDERQRGAFADAGNAQHQIKPLSQIAVGTQTLGNVTYLRGAPCLQPGNVAVNEAPQLRLIDMLEPGLEARDVLFDLLEKGQISRQFRQSWDLA